MDFTKDQIERYSRHLALRDIGPGGQEKLAKARILILGLGGLGSPAALYLCGAGIGTLGLADFDNVDISNLHRQILFNTNDIGLPKVECAKQTLKQKNPDTTIISHHTKLNNKNCGNIISQYDFIIEGSDNFSTKYLINDICCSLSIPFSIGGVLQFKGQVTTVIPGKSGCYRCLFPTFVEQLTCAQAGIIGPVAGLIASVQASEAIKYITQTGSLLTNHLLQVDLSTMDFCKFKFSKNTDCLYCSRQT